MNATLYEDVLKEMHYNLKVVNINETTIKATSIH
jgi:hypothetical protein